MKKNLRKAISDIENPNTFFPIYYGFDLNDPIGYVSLDSKRLYEGFTSTPSFKLALGADITNNRGVKDLKKMKKYKILYFGLVPESEHLIKERNKTL